MVPKRGGAGEARPARSVWNEPYGYVIGEGSELGGIGGSGVSQTSLANAVKGPRGRHGGELNVAVNVVARRSTRGKPGRAGIAEGGCVWSGRCAVKAGMW